MPQWKMEDVEDVLRTSFYGLEFIAFTLEEADGRGEASGYFTSHTPRSGGHSLGAEDTLGISLCAVCQNPVHLMVCMPEIYHGLSRLMGATYTPSSRL